MKLSVGPYSFAEVFREVGLNHDIMELFVVLFYRNFKGYDTER